MKINPGHFFSAFLVFLTPVCSLSQEGNPVLKNYFHTSEETDHLNICIRQHTNGIMLFANSKGLLSFDGHEWKLTTTKNTPILIEPDEQSGKIFAGFYNDFGYFESNETGELTYHSTIPTAELLQGEINKILLDDTYIYYCNENTIIKVDKHSDIVENNWTSKTGNAFRGAVLLRNQLFVNIEGKGLHLLKDKNFVSIAEGSVYAQAELLFSIPYDEHSILIGSTLDDLRLFDGKELKKVKLEAEHYLKENFLTEGIDIGNNQIALSTLGGGYVIADKISGKTLHTINSSTGLPDNEIYALGKDRNGGVWVSHHYGISRLDPHLPFSEFSNYPGLKGNPLSTLYFNNTLYVSTTEGVFYLSKETQRYSPPTSVSPIPHTDTKSEEKKSLHHFLDQVFHKRKFRKKEDLTSKPKNPIHVNISKKPVSYEYQFKKTEGISAKCRQLVPVEDHILVSSNIGLFEIRNKKALEIIKGEYINCIFSEQDNSFYIGLRNGLIYLKKDNSHWKIQKLIKEHLNVYSIAKDYEKNLWIGSNGKIFQLKLDKNKKILSRKEFHIPEFHNEQIVARSVHGIPTFFLSDGVFYFSSSRNAPLKDPVLDPSSSIYRFNASRDDFTWYRSEEGWKGLDSRLEKNDIQIPYLSFFKNIRSIQMDQNASVWVLDGNNEIFRINLNKQIITGNFDLHVRQIKSAKGEFLPIQNLNLAHTENSMHFFLSAPFFLDGSSVQYQYFIEGLTNEWSDWTKDNKIELTYLPVGEHVLHARARNGLGELSDLEKISIAILPPYWKSTWFFALEVIFFFTLILASIFLNRTNHSRFATKAITFLTLILVIEFIIYQLETVITMGNSENPLIRFGFNVMLALMISPVEKILELAISKRRRKIAKLMLLWRKHF